MMTVRVERSSRIRASAKVRNEDDVQARVDICLVTCVADGKNHAAGRMWIDLARVTASKP